MKSATPLLTQLSKRRMKQVFPYVITFKTNKPRPPSLQLIHNFLMKNNEQFAPQVFVDLKQKQIQSEFYGVYLLTTRKKSKEFTHCVIDSGENPIQRMLELNNEITPNNINNVAVDGKNKRKKENDKKQTTVELYRPWDLAAVVYGFQTKIEALEFEYLWKNPFNIGSKSFQQMMKELKKEAEEANDSKALNHIVPKLVTLFHLLADTESPFYRPPTDSHRSLLHVRLLSPEYVDILDEHKLPINKFIRQDKFQELNASDDKILVVLDTAPLLPNAQESTRFTSNVLGSALKVPDLTKVHETLKQKEPKDVETEKRLKVKKVIVTKEGLLAKTE